MRTATGYAARGVLRHAFFTSSVFRPSVYMVVFWVADCESDLRFLKFNMVVPRWWPKI